MIATRTYHAHARSHTNPQDKAHGFASGSTISKMNRFPAPQVTRVSDTSYVVHVDAAQGGCGCWVPLPSLRQRAGAQHALTAWKHQAMSARQTKLCLTKQKLCSQNVQPLHDSYGAAHCRFGAAMFGTGSGPCINFGAHEAEAGALPSTAACCTETCGPVMNMCCHCEVSAL